MNDKQQEFIVAICVGAAVVLVISLGMDIYEYVWGYPSTGAWSSIVGQFLTLLFFAIIARFISLGGE